MIARKREFVDIKTSGYCRSGLGVGSPECNCNVPQSEKRFAFGGPDIQAELDKGSACQCDPGLIIPDSVNSKAALSKFLESEGYKRGTDDYWKFYKMYSGNFQQYQ
jgi:hypothetical protein